MASCDPAAVGTLNAAAYEKFDQLNPGGAALAVAAALRIKRVAQVAAPSEAPSVTTEVSAPPSPPPEKKAEKQKQKDKDAGDEGVSKRAAAKAAKKAEKEAKKAQYKAEGIDKKGEKTDGPAPTPAAPAKAAVPTADATGAIKAAVSLDPPSGTRDFYPDQEIADLAGIHGPEMFNMRTRNWLFNTWKEVAREFAFQEYDAPVLEHEELYKRKAGEEIVDQMYNFADKADNKVTLRPEMTPSLARMVLQTGGKMLLPIKWFSIPQCWRYETVQRGRKREHFQWNMDIIGEWSVSAEVELLAAIACFFQKIGITSDDVGIKINSRKVLQSVIEMYGIPTSEFSKVCVVVDKLDKIGPCETKTQLVALGLTDEVAGKIIASLECKSIKELADLLEDPDAPAVKQLEDVFMLAEAYGIGDWLIFDASVVRGLAYYTGIVFEGFDREGKLRAICGGGRYDKLLSLYSGSPEEVPACGFGFGDCVVMELLKEKGRLPQLGAGIDFVVVPFDAAMRAPSLKITAKLRAAGYTVDVLLEPTKKVKNAFSYADRVGGNKCVFVAPDEWEKGLVRIKDLREQDESKKQVDLPFDNLAAALATAFQASGASASAPSEPKKLSKEEEKELIMQKCYEEREKPGMKQGGAGLVFAADEVDLDGGDASVDDLLDAFA